MVAGPHIARLVAAAVAGALAVLRPVPAVAQQITVTIIPASGSNYTAGQTLNVRIEWCGSYAMLDDASRSITFNGQVAAGFGWYWSSQAGCNDSYVSEGVVTLAEGQNVLNAAVAGYSSLPPTCPPDCPPPPECPPVCDERVDRAPPPDMIVAQNYDVWGEASATWNTPEPALVTPDGEARLVITANGARLPFTIKNPGTAARAYSLTIACTGIVTSCSPPNPALVSVNAGQNVVVWPTLSTSGASLATGTLTLTAGDQQVPTLTDAGSYTLTLGPTGPVVARDQCLTIAAGAGAAYECGDLRLVHALPAVRTLNKPRVPTLLYNSQLAHPYPLVSADVTVPTGALPDSLWATLTVNNVNYTRSWLGSSWGQGGQTRRVVVGFDAVNAGLVTGVYTYQLTITKFVAGNGTPLQQTTGQLPIVRRDSSAFGPGWWLAGWEKLYSLQSGVLWVGGDGSIALYERAGTLGSDTVYLAPLVDRPDTLLHTAANKWKRLLAGGDTVIFGGNGFHERTANRLGYSTQFVLDTVNARLARIDFPPTAAGLSDTLIYSGSPARLTQVNSPDSAPGTFRVTTLVWQGDSVRIVDPGPGPLPPVTFRYQSGGTNRIESRTSRRGAVTRFVYNAGFRLDSAKLDLGPDSLDINVSFCAAEVRGLAVCSPTLLAPESVYTRFDGPRVLPDSLDTMDFWVDGFGSPWRTRDPYGAFTTLTRGALAGTSLVTRVQYANGRIIGATYDARGNLATSTDSSLYAPGQHAITRYQWDQRWDNVTEVILPTQEVTHFGYDPANGNRSWQEDGRGASSRVNFAYYTNGNGTGLVKTVTDPTGAKDSVAYDVRGNHVYSRTPMGYVTTSIVDRLGRPRVVSSPVSGVTRDDSTSYDQRSLPLRTVAYGRAVNGVNSQKVVVRSFYNVDAQLDSLQRWAEPDTADIDTMTTRWRYDLAGRVVAEIAPDLQGDSTRYDPAGNVRSTVTRRGDTLTMVYDRLSRLRRRIVPAVTYPGRCLGIATFLTNYGSVRPYPWFPDGTPASQCSWDGSQWYVDSTQWALTLRADTALYTYGPMGEVLTANNYDAKVKRTYFKSGQVETDTLKIRTWDGVDTLTHVYGITYQYDLSQRPVSLRHPVQLAPRNPGVMDLARYEYDPITGALSAVVDPLGGRFAFIYNFRNDRIRLDRPGGVVESYAYDSLGRLIADTILRGSAAFRRATLQYADAERVGVARNSEAWQDTVSSYYSGLGHLANLIYTLPAYRTQPVDTAHVFSGNRMRLDALGNTVYAKDSSNLTAPFGTQGAQTSDRYQVYERHTGRLTYIVNAQRPDTLWYDRAGNLAYSGKTPWYNPPNGKSLEDHANYYDADNRLRVAEFRTLTLDTAGSEANDWSMTFEVYRYDALGRRIAVRTWRNCDQAFEGMGSRILPCNLGSLKRVVWAGNQELYEIRQWSSQGDYDILPPRTMLENDTTPQWVTREYWDASREFGRVAYTYGPTVDEPLSVIRLALVDTVPNWDIRINWPPIDIAPHWNWRGQPEIGSLADGQLMTCQTTPKGQRCVGPPWRLRPFAFAQQRLDSLDGWWGSFLRDKEDGTGTLYRRNRYMDPATGRFTQEDPIGLAGGLNQYGFANGDPVNFSDPFGLCPPETPWTPECDKPLEDPGLLDPVAWLAGGLAGGVRAGLARLFTRAAGTAAMDALVTSTGTTAGEALATQVAAATGGAVAPLAKSAGWKVVVQVGRQTIMARIKSSGAFRVTIAGVGALTRAGEISADKALTHLTAGSAEEIISLIRKAVEIVGARAH